jgi:hypothetical protein
VADHHTVIDYFLTADGWRYQAVCDCRWPAPWPSKTRAEAESVGRGHEIAMAAMDAAEAEFRSRQP